MEKKRKFPKIKKISEKIKKRKFPKMEKKSPKIKNGNFRKIKKRKFPKMEKKSPKIKKRKFPKIEKISEFYLRIAAAMASPKSDEESVSAFGFPRAKS